ncbi:MAG: site-2 protease family protein [Deltaproteobacteria bacterium]|jgi:Zn-dependent protease|nr:site-2 protease family protein [Deltaproteobacteria bacterium]
MFGFSSEQIAKACLLAPVILLAVTVHEFSHALAAAYQGDPTPKQDGRLTLNPFRHLSLFGTLCFIATNFIGWAKPVRVNPLNFKNPAKSLALLALAGPASNILLSFLCFILLWLNQNYTPFVELLPKSLSQPIYLMLFVGVILNVGMAFFNLLPFPPLDGFRVISYFLPLDWVIAAEKYQLFFLIALIALMYFGFFRILLGNLTDFILKSLM